MEGWRFKAQEGRHGVQYGATCYYTMTDMEHPSDAFKLLLEGLRVAEGLNKENRGVLSNIEVLQMDQNGLEYMEYGETLMFRHEIDAVQFKLQFCDQ